MTQFGFFINQAECIGCKACQVACSDRNDLVAGLTVRTVSSYETGTYPEAYVYNYSAACNHCANPACVAQCPTGACQKAEDGTVFRDEAVCIGCGTCVSACPYGHPSLDADKGKAVRCDGCKSLRDAGLNPVCVDACCMRALEFGDIDELKAKYPDAVSDLPFLPSSTETNPSTIIAPHMAATNDQFVKFVF